MKGLLPAEHDGKPVEIRLQDEARVGRKGTLISVWAWCGTRPRAVQDTRYEWVCLSGAVCPSRAVGAGLVLPRADIGAMNLHSAEIAEAVAPGAHAVLVLDGAGWHVSKGATVPDDIGLLKLPPHAPDLNPAENVWAYLRGTRPARRVFETDDDIVAACRETWNAFIADAATVTAITARRRATCQNP